MWKMLNKILFEPSFIWDFASAHALLKEINTVSRLKLEFEVGALTTRLHVKYLRKWCIPLKLPSYHSL